MKTILLIEDNFAILENLAEYLDMEGYKILTASTGLRGIVLAKQYIPDLIICDVMMYDMGGREVLRILLNTTTTRQIPFIFSTSLAEKTIKVETLSLGADDIIVKPYELKTLLVMAKEWLIRGSNRSFSH
jgi:DNA-binding response OmpR family regulator